MHVWMHPDAPHKAWVKLGLTSRIAWALIHARIYDMKTLCKALEYGAAPELLYCIENLGKKSTAKILKVLWDGGYLFMLEDVHRFQPVKEEPDASHGSG